MMIAPVFEDEYIIVVSKRARLLVVPTPKKERNTLTNKVNRYLSQKRESAFPCHRLDRDVSGLMIYAKSKKLQQDIMNQFRQRKVNKMYLGIAHGKVPSKIKKVKKDVKAPRKSSKPALTYIKVIRKFKDFSILKVSPKTGRTNQIRIHLADMGHPLVGERKYTLAKSWLLKFNRVCLHSFYLGFQHPVSREYLEVCDDIPPDIKRFLYRQRVEVTFKGMNSKDNLGERLKIGVKRLKSQ